MAVDGSEKDIAIAGFHEFLSGIYFMEHGFSSNSTSCVSNLLVMSMDRLLVLGPYELPWTPYFLNDSTRP